MCYYRDVYKDGVKVDRHWFCSDTCVEESVGDELPHFDYPPPLPGSITTPTENPQACAICQEPVGNPLTEKGLANVLGYVLHGDPEGRKYARAYGINVEQEGCT